MKVSDFKFRDIKHEVFMAFSEFMACWSD